MRCENCPYMQKTSYEYDEYDCFLGIEESEDKKGRCGCKYNMKQLKKFNEEILDELQKDGEYFYNLYKTEELK